MKRELNSAAETTGFDGTKESPSENVSSGSSAAPSPKRKVSAPLDTDCLICGDRATGKHYGSISCDGCKGFFRRTIRKKHVYVCRFNATCVVDRDMRNSCRSCRFSKCIENGMRPEAVQLERDRLSATIRRPSATDENGNNQCGEEASSAASAQNVPSDSVENFAKNSEAEACLNNLMEAESRMREMRRASVISSSASDAFRTAGIGDVTESMHQQLILMVEWAKHLKTFRELPLSSQIGLLRHFSAQHLIICAAFRSMNIKDAVWLTNESCLPRDAPKIPDVNRVAARVLDHLTAPMRNLHLEEREYVALKAVAFFDPLAKDVEGSTTEIEKTRQQILSSLEHYVTKVSEHRQLPLRLANLLLLLPQIVSISRDLIEEAQLAKIFGLANVDELMAELLLPSPNTYSHLKSSVTTPSITLSNSIAASTQQIGNGSELAAIAAARNESLNFSVHNQFPVTMTIIAPRPVYPFNLPSS